MLVTVRRSSRGEEEGEKITGEQRNETEKVFSHLEAVLLIEKKSTRKTEGSAFVHKILCAHKFMLPEHKFLPH
jgi:hypothetical protein